MSSSHPSLPISVNEPTRLRQAGIAGGLSFLLHSLLILLGSLLLQGSLPRVAPEPERTVGVVLATPTASREVSYYQDSPTVEPGTLVASEATSVKQQADSAPAGLPTAANMPAADSVPQLPGSNRVLGLPAVDSASAGITGGTGERTIIDPAADIAEVLAIEAKRTKKAGPVGPPATLSLFGSPAASGHSFLFLIDRSHSMGAEGLGALSAAEGELLVELTKLQPNHSFQIVAYNEAPKYLRERKLIPATPAGIEAAREFMKLLVAAGPTDHTLALISALRLEPDVLYLFTDGDDPYIGVRQRERIKEVAGHTQIHCVQFGWRKPVDETSRNCLQELARQHGGSYTFVDMAARK